jgi:hypothetical protein
MSGPEPGQQPDEPWDTSLWDAVSLVDAMRAEKTADVARILKRAPIYETCLDLAKMLVDVLDEQGIPADWFRFWAQKAADRP